MVLTKKVDRMEARLVIRGFEDPDYYIIIKDSPTCSKEAFRVMLAEASWKGWKSNALDIKTAFLQGNSLSRDVFVKPPPESETNGVVDAARHWYQRVKKEILGTGCQISSLDRCLFYLCKNGQLHGMVSSHVDDFWWSGDDHFEHSVIHKLLSIFDVRTVETAPFKYLGFDVHEDSTAIILDKSAYVNEIKEIFPSKDVGFEALKRPFRSLLGQL